MSAELIPELQRLGQRLAQARQARGFSLDEQADRLHMGAEQLRALEEGDRDELPEAVFVVAQARRVAASLDLNIDDDIAALRANRAFQTRPPQRQPIPDPHPAAARVDAAAVASSGRPPLRLLGLGAALIAAAGLAWGWQRSPTGVRPGPLVPPPTASEQVVRPGPSQAELVLRSAEPSWVEVRSASGKVLLRGTLEGEHRFPLNGELQKTTHGRSALFRGSAAGLGTSPGE